MNYDGDQENSFVTNSIFLKNIFNDFLTLASYTNLLNVLLSYFCMNT